MELFRIVEDDAHLRDPESFQILRALNYVIKWQKNERQLMDVWERIN